eukprot:8870115-Pyramimonas_sp.AAC.1
MLLNLTPKIVDIRVDRDRSSVLRSGRAPMPMLPMPIGSQREEGCMGAGCRTLGEAPARAGGPVRQRAPIAPSDPL